MGVQFRFIPWIDGPVPGTAIAPCPRREAQRVRPRSNSDPVRPLRYLLTPKRVLYPGIQVTRIRIFEWDRLHVQPHCTTRCRHIDNLARNLTKDYENNLKVIMKDGKVYKNTLK